jgi:hypothetical protein
MKNLLWLAAIVCVPLAGEEAVRFELANGTVVYYQPFAGSKPAGGITQVPGGLRRKIDDGRGRPALAFDVHVDPVDRSTLRLSLTQVPGSPFFAQAPEPRDLRPGDHVMVDVLEQAGTGKKLFDTLCAGFRATPMRLPMSSARPPSVIAPGAILRLDHAMIKDGDTVLAKSSATLSGATLRLALPNGGEYTLSSEPGPGFRLEALLYEESAHTVVVFPDGATMYGVVSASAIVDQPGSWLVWVRKDASPTVTPKPAATSEFTLDALRALPGMARPDAHASPTPPPPELKIWVVL